MERDHVAFRFEAFRGDLVVLGIARRKKRSLVTLCSVENCSPAATSLRSPGRRGVAWSISNWCRADLVKELAGELESLLLCRAGRLDRREERFGL
jgi:hypothetical protein